MGWWWGLQEDTVGTSRWIPVARWEMAVTSLLSASLPTGQSCEQHTLRLHTAGPPDTAFLYTDSSSVVLCILIYQIINFLPVYVAKGDIQRWQCGLMENMWVLESILMCLPAPPFIQPIMSDL